MKELGLSQNPIFRIIPIALLALSAGLSITSQVQAVEATVSAENVALDSGEKPFNFVLGGNQEVPAVDTEATGSCVGILSADQATFTVNCNHNVEGATVAHIHEAPPGVSGDIIFPFDSVESPIQQTFNFTPEDVAALFAGNFYVNVHSADFPAGEIRGQIVAPVNGSFSGAWFNPERDGEGFLLEVTNRDDPTLVATWFTYKPADDDGEQAWLMGSGPLRLNESVITNTIITEGAEFGEDFDPEEVNRIPWGTLKFTFTSCTTAIVEYDSVIEDFGSGTLRIQRLTPPLIGQEGACP